MSEYTTTGSLNIADWPEEAKRYTKGLEAELDRLRYELGQVKDDLDVAEAERDRLRNENEGLQLACEVVGEERDRLTAKCDALDAQVDYYTPRAAQVDSPQERDRLRNENEGLQLACEVVGEERDRLREALERIATLPWDFESSSYGQLQDIARAALEGTSDE